jgi:hypothetical protein
MNVKFTHGAVDSLIRAAFISYERPPDNGELEELVALVKQNVANFIAYYGRCPFLMLEPVHKFDAIEFVDPQNQQDKSTLSLLLTVQDDCVLVLSTEEARVDDMYDIRKVIAESAMPEFYNDTLDTQNKMPEND